ncbi:Uncharacterized membrane protein YgaE, UPF0421/DUF939 family [Clostridium sp. DSM 8431]|uniref:aromatic acid exporter family protein n=1 Tax=Clostridium sp. DSM 8431 TaxID=1761781 RepID=UPI0008F37E9E|nr:aromatic acid exporter family protein [Clostridium sp. DSM 8431]SFU41004.1 Uncharacterized membrane protein YgaE, UPF0421/DUF939 family [Clostridium sp. DSM 8431]
MREELKQAIKVFHLKTFKMTVSATISIMIANYFGLKFGVTAGVISILSILNTKKESIRVGGRRLLACLLAIILSYALYQAFGNNTFIFALFLLIYIPITIKFNIQEGLVPGAVLSTHLLTSANINGEWIINEIELTVIGIGVAILFNLYAPSLEEKFKRNREMIESRYRVILSHMAKTLMNDGISAYDDVIMSRTDELIKETRKIAYEISDNSLFEDKEYYTAYIEMRIMQMDTLKRMKKYFFRFYMHYEQTKILADFTEEVAVNIHEDNDCALLIEKINNLKNNYKKMELPKTREEFENRALLFQFLNDLEDFLIIKRDYKLMIDEENKK